VAIIRRFSFESIKIILYNSRDGVFDEEISTSKPLLEHSTSILGVWENHVILLKNITLYYQKQKHENGTLMFLFLIIHGYTFKHYYVVHPHTQYRGTML